MLEFAFGEGVAADGELVRYEDVRLAERSPQKLDSPGILAIKGLGQFFKKKKYRNPDSMGNPKEKLRKLFPKHQQIDGARRIAAHMDVNHNTSASFNAFVSGVKRLASTEKFG